MSAESYAFVSVDDDNKNGLGVFARGLLEHYDGIVSLGKTASVIQKAGVPVTLMEEFLGDPALTAHAETIKDPREKREFNAVRLAPHIWQAPNDLAVDRTPIGLVYITLMTPERLTDTQGNLAGVKEDKGGALMINAAIEGGRDPITGQAQMKAYLERFVYMSPAERRALLIPDAMLYLYKYAGLAMRIGSMGVEGAQSLD